MEKQTTKQTNILVDAQAMQNCVKSENYTWYDIWEQRVTDKLLSVLPHGSGIDCKWEFEINKGFILCHNSFHRMNDQGCYCGYIDFTLAINAKHRLIDKGLDFKITGRFGKHQDIRDYLYEDISYSLENL